MINCVHCGKNPHQKNEPTSKMIKFEAKGKILTAKAKVYNDAFYEIVEGKHKGNLVHLWSIRK